MTMDHDKTDVQLELHDIVRHREAYQKTFWIVWPLAFLANAALLLLFLLIARWMFGESNSMIVTSVTCVAYAITVIVWRVEGLRWRVNRMEMHALTLHNEILIAQEKIDDISYSLNKLVR